MNVYQKLNAARVREVLNYVPETGVFTWKRRAGCRADVPLGTDNGNGYLRITIDGRSHYAHRLALMYMLGDVEATHVDHINGNRADNRICNLRPASPSDNQRNRHGAQVNSRSGVLGVSWHKRCGKWQAHRNGKYLGVFARQEDAITAWENA